MAISFRILFIYPMVPCFKDAGPTYPPLFSQVNLNPSKARHMVSSASSESLSSKASPPPVCIFSQILCLGFKGVEVVDTWWPSRRTSSPISASVDLGSMIWTVGVVVSLVVVEVEEETARSMPCERIPANLLGLMLANTRTFLWRRVEGV